MKMKHFIRNTVLVSDPESVWTGKHLEDLNHVYRSNFNRKYMVMGRVYSAWCGVYNL